MENRLSIRFSEAATPRSWRTFLRNNNERYSKNTSRSTSTILLWISRAGGHSMKLWYTSLGRKLWTIKYTARNWTKKLLLSKDLLSSTSRKSWYLHWRGLNSTCKTWSGSSSTITCNFRWSLIWLSFHWISFWKDKKAAVQNSKSKWTLWKSHTFTLCAAF